MLVLWVGVGSGGLESLGLGIYSFSRSLEVAKQNYIGMGYHRCIVQVVMISTPCFIKPLLVLGLTP